MIQNHLAMVQCGFYLGHIVAESFVDLTLTAVIYIWHDPVFHETLSEDQGHVGAVVCPAEVDTSTDEGGPYTVTGTVEVQNVTGTLEIHYQTTEAFGNKSISDTFSSKSVKVTKSKTSRKQTSDQNDSTKTQKTKITLSTKRNYVQIKLRNLSKRPHTGCIKNTWHFLKFENQHAQ